MKMNNLPKVSIVTPSFNQGQFIAKTIESVLNQDYPDLEYWVIDGESTDNTRDILTSYTGDSRFHWIMEADRGQANAVNKGWSITNGDVLGWLNSDDTYKPNAVKEAVICLNKFPSAAFVYSHCETIDENDKLLEIYRVKQSDFTDQLLFKCLIPQQTVFLRREIFDAMGIIREDLHFALDQEYFLRILQHYNGKFINACWAQQRLHSSAKTQSQWWKVFEEWWNVANEYANDIGPNDTRNGEVLSRAALNMFLAKCAQTDYDNAFVFLEKAFKNNRIPFGTFSNCIKYTEYALRKWNDLDRLSEIFQGLRSKNRLFVKGGLTSNFINGINGYNFYQNNDYDAAREMFLQLDLTNLEIKKDLYLKLLLYIVIRSPRSIGFIRKIKKKITA